MPCPQHIKFLNTHATMIEEGLELMLVGMGVVFSFLVLLVVEFGSKGLVWDLYAGNVKNGAVLKL